MQSSWNAHRKTLSEPKMNRLLLAALFFSLAHATPVGAPIEACDTLEPQHGVVGQTTPSPYAFVAVNNGDGTYQISVEITDTAAPGFKGFILQARVADSATSIGAFGTVPADAHTLDCHGPADTVTHSINETRTSTSFTWNSGGTPVGGIVIHGAVVQVKDIYWAGLTSVDLGTLP